MEVAGNGLKTRFHIHQMIQHFLYELFFGTPLFSSVILRPQLQFLISVAVFKSHLFFFIISQIIGLKPPGNLTVGFECEGNKEDLEIQYTENRLWAPSGGQTR